MPLSPETLFFLRPVVRMPPDLLERRLVTASDEDTELLESLMGQTSFPEAFASVQARDRALGFIDTSIEFIPTSWAQAQAAGLEDSDIAVGPALGEDGFDLIAPMVVSAVVRRMHEDGDIRNADGAIRLRSRAAIRINRVQYEIEAVGDDTFRVLANPIYDEPANPSQIHETALWLQGVFATEVNSIACRDRS